MSSAQRPLVSVVIPTYNRAALLERAISSVLSQTYSNLECIVVDDASRDETREIVSRVQRDERVVYVRHDTNRRGAAARNTGIEAARGQLLAFLDDDDEWLPEKLAKQVQLLLRSPDNVGLVYCWMDYYGKDGCVERQHHPTNRGSVFHLMLDANAIGGCPTVLLRNDVIRNVGGFNEALTIEDDWEFLMRVCKRYEVDLVPEVLVRVDYGHGLPQTSNVDYDDRATCVQMVKVIEAKLEILSDVRGQYRLHVSRYHGFLGYLYGRLGDSRRSLVSFLTAFYSCPYNLGTIRIIARLAKWRVGSVLSGRNPL